MTSELYEFRSFEYPKTLILYIGNYKLIHISQVYVSRHKMLKDLLSITNWKYRVIITSTDRLSNVLQGSAGVAIIIV